MDEQTIIRAKLLAAVACRAMDYHALTTLSMSASKGTNKETITKVLELAERSLAVTLENMLEEGLE